MIYIRADMNTIIATGHIMRCLAIADAAKLSGEDTTFIVADTQAEQLIESSGYSCIVMNTKWNDLESELSILKKIIKEQQIMSLLVDSYFVTFQYLNSLQKMVKLVYLDDLNLFHYPVNAIICYANYWRKFEYEKYYSNIELFLGMQYAPVQHKFSNCPKKKIEQRINKLLIMSGGTDQYNVIGNLLNKLDFEEFDNIDVICGKYNESFDSLRKLYDDEVRIKIHSTVSDIERYMMNADLAISAGGTPLYELCACGTPAISYSFADNQLDNVRQFEIDDLIDYAGDARYEKNIFINIKHYIDKYQNNYELRKRRSIRMQKLIDGKGAVRVAKVLMEDKNDTVWKTND